MQKKSQEMFLSLEIIAFELVALETRIYWEKILVIRCQYVTKTEFFDLISFQSDQKI